MPDEAWPRRSTPCESGATPSFHPGCAATPPRVAPRTSAGGSPAARIPRFTATASTPLAASGMFNFAPPRGVTVVLLSLGFALEASAGWIGAAGMSGLEGEARRRAAAVVTAASGARALPSTLLRMLD